MVAALPSLQKDSVDAISGEKWSRRRVDMKGCGQILAARAWARLQLQGRPELCALFSTNSEWYVLCFGSSDEITPGRGRV
jgi:hypothetical protein